MTETRLGRQTPTQSVTIPYSKTRGQEAAELYAKTGNELLEWQQLLQCDIMAVNDDGLWMHQKYGYSVPRRNGKSENVLARCLWGLKNGERILYTAHRATTSHAVWERLDRMCEKAGIKISSSFKAFTGNRQRKHKSGSRRNRKNHWTRTKGTIKRTCERRSGKSVDKTNV